MSFVSFLAKVDMKGTYKCGTLDFDIPGTFPYMVSSVITIIKILVPILLIIFGLIDLGKAVAASKEDEIKKGQQTFIKRAITAVLVFFVIQLVQLVVTFVSGKDADVANCFNCFVNGVDDPDKGCSSK